MSCFLSEPMSAAYISLNSRQKWDKKKMLMSLTVLVSLFCDLQCFRFLPADFGTVTNTVVSCQVISREATMRPDSRNILNYIKPQQ